MRVSGKSFVVLLALACPSVWAQVRGAGVIAGTVLDEASGDPVKKVVVTLTWYGKPESYATAMTDGSGVFSFDSLPPGKYTLRAAAWNSPGTESKTSDFIALGPGERKPDIKLTVARPCSISGTVLGTDGEPVPRAQVMALTGNPKEPYPRGWSGTDAKGEYRLTRITPGRYYVAVHGGAVAYIGPMTGPGEELPVTTFYGGGTDIGSATPVLVRPGEQVKGIDIRTVRSAAVSVKGRVVGVPEVQTGPSGPRNYSGVSIQFAQTGSGFNPGGSIGFGAGPPDYQFEARVSQGEYRVTASTDTAGKRLYASQLVTVGPQTGEIVLTLTPAVDLSGQVRSGGIAPLGDVQVMLNQHEQNYFFGSGQMVSRPDKEGKLKFDQMMPGSWDVNVTGLPHDAFVQSIQFGGQAVAGRTIEIASGSDGPLVVNLSSDGANVDGQLDDDVANRRGLDVLLARSDGYTGPAQVFFHATSGPDAKFKFDGIPPGRYRIVVLEQAIPPDFAGADAEQRVSKLGAELEISAGARLQVNPPVIPAARMMEVLR